MAYPETLLRNSPAERDADYGGASASKWGKLAFAWVNSVLQFFEGVYLDVIYQPNGRIFVVVQQAVAAGDVVCFFPDIPISNSRYYAKRYTSGTNVQILGVAMKPASAGAVAEIATYGIVPASVTGLIATSGVSFDVGLNTATGRMRSAQTGDVILGRCDGQSNMLFDAHGEAV
jgi:hypothetical protein